MSLRKKNKDHLKAAPPKLASSSSLPENQNQDPLVFWTEHKTEPVLVDLRHLRDGAQASGRTNGSWNGPYSGRPELIEEILPAIREAVLTLGPNSISQYQNSFRAWWRMLDKFESENAGKVAKVERVAHLSELHREYALTVRMNYHVFSYLRGIANATRAALGIPRLFWAALPQLDRTRTLPPAAHADSLRHALRREWYGALDTWEQAERLGNSDLKSLQHDELRVAKNIQRLKQTIVRVKHPRPTGQQLWAELTAQAYDCSGFNTAEMFRGLYPDSTSIRAAFHLCLANSGWNASVLIDLDATDQLVEPNPKDPARYILRGFKSRGKSEQITQGLYKSQSSTGMVIEKLIQQTAPLRERLVSDLHSALEEHQRLTKHGAAIPSELRSRILELQRGTKSVWLYVSTSRNEILWLDKKSYAASINKNKGSNFLSGIIDKLNLTRPGNKKIIHIKSSDFRDCFAHYAFNLSGGSIHYLMKVLGHRRPGTTQIYIDNNIVNAASANMFRTFSNSTWTILQEHQRIDPTMIAKLTKDGSLTTEDVTRLKEYRTLMKSRLGIGCKSPTNPPRRIAPTFKANGRRVCHVHRCTLCNENAVILPESFQGLCKRRAELAHLQSSMSTEAFIESDFSQELSNTDLALELFDRERVDAEVAIWSQKISLKTHRPIEFNLL